MLFSRDKKILDLCGGTGVWSKPYKEAGYDVRVITLPEYNVIDYIPPKDVYGILAAPPCTMFSLARNRYDKTMPRDFVEGLSVVDACIRIAWAKNPIFFALENPVGLLGRWLGKPTYMFDPWYFGDPYTKKTALWGRFNSPVRFVHKKRDIMTEEQIARCKINNEELPSISEITSGSQAEKRAITPPGFAKAFYEANK